LPQNHHISLMLQVSQQYSSGDFFDYFANPALNMSTIKIPPVKF